MKKSHEENKSEEKKNPEKGLFSFVNRAFFPRTFFYKIILEPEKKVLKNKVSNW